MKVNFLAYNKGRPTVGTDFFYSQQLQKDYKSLVPFRVNSVGGANEMYIHGGRRTNRKVHH